MTFNFIFNFFLYQIETIKYYLYFCDTVIAASKTMTDDSLAVIIYFITLLYIALMFREDARDIFSVVNRSPLCD
jgi:hypothetical protein